MAYGRGKEKPDGEIRQSQLITTFGAGAMVDLTERSVLIRGLDHWRYPHGKKPPIIEERRLPKLLVERLEKEGIRLSRTTPFRAPPAGDSDDPDRWTGIDVVEFPTWFVCQNPECRTLIRPKAHEAKGGRYYHEGCDEAPWWCVPVRFVVTCKAGHLDEFPWVAFVHGEGSKCRGPLRLLESATGEFSELTVKCRCGAERALSDAMVEQTNFYCTGRRPWLGQEGDEDCELRQRLLVRTATNAYFSQTISALTLPASEDPLKKLVAERLDLLSTATPETLPAILTIEALESLRSHDPKAILAAVEGLKSSKTDPPEHLRTAEYRHFMAQPVADATDEPGAEDNFWARQVLPKHPPPAHIERVVLAKKLREVRVQLGFTRNEPVSPDLEGEFDLGVQSARVGLFTDWLPAHEVWGEGLFIRLDEQQVRQWEQRSAVQERQLELREGHEAAMKGAETRMAFPGARFYLLHSLSHLLITAISLECGYGASAIRERIYCAPAGAETPMAAILLSTGTPGSEGTLGGLVGQGLVLVEHLRRAFDIAELCSNDPVCADHTPRRDHSERFLEGAACHGCLYVAEPSCERGNRYLDRALVVPTIGKPHELAFFSERP